MKKVAGPAPLLVECCMVYYTYYVGFLVVFLANGGQCREAITIETKIRIVTCAADSSEKQCLIDKISALPDSRRDHDSRLSSVSSNSSWPGFLTSNP
jgi:hypothetical protein